MKAWKWVLGFGAAGALAEYAVSDYFFKRTLLRKNAKRERTQNMSGTNWDAYVPNIRACREWTMEQTNEEVSITSDDGLQLFGRYFKNGSSRKNIICFHGYTSEGMNDYPCLIKFYLEAGYNVLVIDERAHGKSEGTYIGFGCLDRWDALLWIEYIVNRFGDEQEIILHGTSMGGATVLMTSGLELPPNVKGIISDCAFTSAWDVFTSVLHSMYHIPAFPILQIADHMCRKKAGYGLAECNSAQEVKKSNVPILFIHGDADTFVPYKMCHEIYENCASDKQILIIKDASHAEAYHKDTEAYEGAIKSFLGKLVPQEL